MTQQPVAQLNFGLSGHFKLIAHGGKRGTVVLAEFDNLILDQGLNKITVSAPISAAQVGTSNTAVSVGQTGLSGYLAGTSNEISSVSSYVAGSPGYTQTVWTYRFATGVAAGNLQEVGVGSTTTTGNLFSRALIVDGGGAPTTVTILSDESLDVVYTLRVYLPTDVTGSVTISGTSYSYTIRPADVTGSNTWTPKYIITGPLANDSSGAVSYTGAIGTVTSQPSGTASSTQGSANLNAYSNNSYLREFVLTQGLTAGNVSGGTKSIHTRLLSSFGPRGIAFQIEFSPNIPKDSTKTFTLTMRFAWARRP